MRLAPLLCLLFGALACSPAAAQPKPCSDSETVPFHLAIAPTEYLNLRYASAQKAASCMPDGAAPRSKRSAAAAVLQQGAGAEEVFLHERWEGDRWAYENRRTYEFDDARSTTRELYEEWRSEEWAAQHRNTYHRDTAGNLAEHQFERREAGTWVMYSRGVFTHDAAGRLKKVVYESRRDGALIPFRRTSLEHDVAGNETRRVYELSQNGAWSFFERASVTYNADRRRTSELREVWQDEDWLNVRRGIFTFDEVEGWEEEVYDEWTDGEWSRIWHSRYEFDGRRSVQRFQAWSNGVLTDARRVVHVYDDSWAETLFSTWESGAWVDTERWTTENDRGANTWTHRTDYRLDGSWVSAKRTTYVYDDGGHTSSSLSELMVDGTWINDVRSTRSIRSTVAREEPLTGATFDLGDVFPNPTRDGVTTRFSVDEAQPLRLEVLDVLGRKVAVLFNATALPGHSYTAIFDTAPLAPGAYFLRLTGIRGMTTKKVVVAR